MMSSLLENINNINLFFAENFSGALKNSQLNRCLLHREIWQSMNQSKNQESLVDVCSTISEALKIIENIKDNNDGAKIDVLFTGSIHLIGSTLSLL